MPPPFTHDLLPHALFQEIATAIDIFACRHAAFVD